VGGGWLYLFLGGLELYLEAITLALGLVEAVGEVLVVLLVGLKLSGLFLGTLVELGELSLEGGELPAEGGDLLLELCVALLQLAVLLGEVLVGVGERGDLAEELLARVLGGGEGPLERAELGGGLALRGLESLSLGLRAEGVEIERSVQDERALVGGALHHLGDVEELGDVDCLFGDLKRLLETRLDRFLYD